MVFDPEKHHRRSIRLRGYDYSRAGVYFVTLCTHHHEFLFGDIEKGRMVLNPCGGIVLEKWRWLDTRYEYIVLDEFIIMPNHFHGIIMIAGRGGGCKGGSRTAPTTDYNHKPLGRLIGAFKTVSTKQINELNHTPGVKLWQRNYWEHIIRDETELHRIREYIINNPARWQDDPLHDDGIITN